MAMNGSGAGKYPAMPLRMWLMGIGLAVAAACVSIFSGALIAMKLAGVDIPDPPEAVTISALSSRWRC
jgi:hypothetical protein